MHTARTLTAALLAACLSLTACTGDDEPPQPAPTPIDPSIAASAEAELRAEVDADIKKAEARLEPIRSQVNRASTREARLEVIITAYCGHLHDIMLGRVPSSTVQIETEEGLSELYDNNWRAGTRWSTPLWTAAAQTGGCPELGPQRLPAGG